MAESTYKVRRKGYTIVYRSVAQDKRLSLKARGLFLLMQSLPDDWRLTQSGLARVAGCGRDQIRAALKELQNVGYLVAEQSHDAGGKFAGSVYILQEEAPESPEPLSENPTTVSPQNPPLSGKPSTEKPSTENPTLQNTIDTNTPLTPQGGKRRASPKMEPVWKPERFAAFWEFYRTRCRGEARLDAVKAWDKLRPDDTLISVIARDLQRRLASDPWNRGIGIPYAASYLNKRRWTDSPPPAPNSPTETEVDCSW